MKLTDKVYIVASGDAGCSLSHYRDCTVFLIDGGSELALIDAGIGEESETIVQNIRDAGFDPEKVTKILLTHGHADHSGGALALKNALHADVYALKETAEFLTNGDTHGIALDVAKEAGAYEAGYIFSACPTTPLEDGAEIQVGDLRLTCISTPGHCVGHAAYYGEFDGQKVLFSGDLVFPFGKVILQNIWDCGITDYAESMKKIKDLKIDALFCAHSSILLNRGYKAVEEACAAFDKLGVPANLC